MRADCSSSLCEPFFSGLYLGGNAGFVSYTSEKADLFGLFGFGEMIERNTSWTAGAQMGYDSMWKRALVGLVVDWNWSDAETRVTNPAAPPNVLIKGRMYWFTTIRSRVGIAMENVLFYITGGAAVADLKSHIAESTPVPPAFSFENHFQKCRWGWTLGIGSELVLGRRWSLNADCLYMRFVSQTVSLTVPSQVSPTTQLPFKFYDEAWSGRISLNYHFSTSRQM